MPEIPRKPFYKPSEVCALTDTQPYVLRFWESEFPQLNLKQGVYRRADLELVLRIKEMLNEQDCTIAEVRNALGKEGNGGSSAARGKAAEAPRAPEAVSVQTGRSAKKAGGSVKARGVLPFSEPEATLPADSVPRSRYEDALEEVAHLRLELQEAEALLRKAEATTRKGLEDNQRLRERSEAAIAQVEQLIARLS